MQPTAFSATHKYVAEEYYSADLLGFPGKQLAIEEVSSNFKKRWLTRSRITTALALRLGWKLALKFANQFFVNPRLRGGRSVQICL